MQGKLFMSKHFDAFDMLSYDDLTDDLKIVADVIGLEATIKLMKALQGISIYFPQITKLVRFVSQYMKQNPGKSLKVIAYELSVSESYLRKFI